MERVEDEVVSIVGPPMAGDDFSATADHNLAYHIRGPERPDDRRPPGPNSHWSGI